MRTIVHRSKHFSTISPSRHFPCTHSPLVRRFQTFGWSRSKIPPELKNYKQPLKEPTQRESLPPHLEALYKQVKNSKGSTLNQPSLLEMPNFDDTTNKNMNGIETKMASSTTTTPTSTSLLDAATASHATQQNLILSDKRVDQIYKSSTSQLHVPIVHYRNNSEISTTTLSNGVKVASVDNHSNMCVVTVEFKNSGIRYDPIDGISLVLNKMCFQSSKKYNHDLLMELFDKIMFETQVDHEHKEYTTIFIRHHLDEAIPLLADNILNPILAQGDVDRVIESLEENVQEEFQNPAMSTVLNDQIFSACFGTESSARPTLILPPKNLTSHQLREYSRSILRPENCVISAVGVDHNQLVKLCEKYFEFPKDIPPPPTPLYPTPLKWIGGESSFAFTGDAVDLARQNIPTVTACVLSFKGPGFLSEELFPTVVLEAILGGGDSFSVGGPGKGLQTIIHRDYMTRYPVYSFHASHTAFHDVGVFTIHTSTTPEYIGYLPHALADLCQSVPMNITEQDLQRGKNRLLAIMLTSLEHPKTLSHAIAGDLLHFKQYHGVDYIRERVEKVTLQDVRDAWYKMMSENIAYTKVGAIENLPDKSYFDQIQRGRR